MRSTRSPHVGFLLYDGFRLFSDGRKNLEENLTAGLADVGGLFVPAPPAAGAAVRARTHADDLIDVLRETGHRTVHASDP